MTKRSESYSDKLRAATPSGAPLPSGDAAMLEQQKRAFGVAVHGWGARKFCVEQAVQIAMHQPGINAADVARDLFKFMSESDAATDQTNTG